MSYLTIDTLIHKLLVEASQDGENWPLFRDAAWHLEEYVSLRTTYLAELAENNRLRAELERAVRDINRIGPHHATIDGCPICALVRSYGFDPEALRES